MRVVIHKNGMLEMSIINVIFLTNAEKCFRVVFLLLLGPLKPASQWSPGRSPGRKRIWCTLKLPESPWWQSFWISWIPCFTVERSKLSIN